VAFLAAGQIIQSRGQIHGLTTGAAMWLAGAIGVSCGAGHFEVALLATGIAIVILTVVSLIERILPENQRSETDQKTRSR
jgi:putative Mg2+ transporter-C (MgtC) family protein